MMNKKQTSKALGTGCAYLAMTICVLAGVAAVLLLVKLIVWAVVG